MKRIVLTVAIIALTVMSLARVARADVPATDLMTRLSVHAANFEKMKKRASYSVEGKMERLTNDGTADSVKEMKGRVQSDGTNQRFDVVRYKEDGTDKTAEAQKKARERAAEKKKPSDKKDFHMPFLASEQTRYTFEQIDVDPKDPNRIRISFVPKARAEDTIEGSAWVDAREGTVVSAGFKMSQTPTFVDYVHITVEFGARTPLGPAVSRVKMDGKGGILFLSKAFRVDAMLSDYAISP
jgi:hypothetical protein